MTEHNTYKNEKCCGVLNEWGIPNWRDERAYGDVNNWTADRWRWEFFRRREDLRKFFIERAEAQYILNQKEINNTNFHIDSFAGKPDEPGFSVYSSDCVELFGYIAVPNPRIGAQPPGLLKPMESYWSHRNVIMGNKRDDEYSVGRQVRGKLALVGVRLTKKREKHLGASLLDDFPVSLEQREVAVKFNLNLPLEAQIENARERLRVEQKAVHGTLLQKRRHITKWFNYLRSLDAKEAGATWIEVASISKNTAKTAHTGRDIWEQARNLCFNF